MSRRSEEEVERLRGRLAEIRRSQCRGVRCRTLSLTSWSIDPLPFSLPIPRCVFLTILAVMREGDGLARQRFCDCLSTLLTYFLLRREISLLQCVRLF